MRNKKTEFFPFFKELKLDASEAFLNECVKLLGDEVFVFKRAESHQGGFRPIETIIAFDAFKKFEMKSGLNPFEKIQTELSKIKMKPNRNLTFFQGGALGYFSYDSIRHLEPVVRVGHKSDLPQPFDAEFSFFNKAIILDHVHSRVIVLSGALGRKQISKAKKDLEKWVRFAEKCLLIARAAQSGARPLQEYSKSEIKLSEMTPALGKNRFIQSVKRLKDHIKNGDIFQAVLSDRFKIRFEGDSFKVFSFLSQLSASPYQFYFKKSDRVFLGASPEMLLKKIGDEIETHPIAGTRPVGRDRAEDQKLIKQLLASPKEKAEHLMLVDLSRNDIGRVSRAGTVRVESFMKVHRFGSVVHLISKVKGKLLKNVGGIEALASCFPAGTLSGAPKIRAMQLLADLEPVSRGFYGGAVVAASFTGDLDSCISIRSIQIQKNEAIVQAGAGIVADSSPIREYQEIEHKSRMARRALYLAGASK